MLSRVTFLSTLLLAIASAPAAENADALMRSGADAYAKGDYATAQRDWKVAEESYAKSENAAGQVDALTNLGAVLQQDGKFGIAITTLLNARDLAEQKALNDRIAGIDNALGVAYTFTRQPERADESLSDALKLAQDQNDEKLQASIRNNLGNLYAGWAEVSKESDKQAVYTKSFDHYTASADLAQKSGDATLAAKATTNAAFSAARGGQLAQANDLNVKAFDAVRALPDSIEKANLLIAVGQTDQSLLTGKFESVPEARLQRRAFDAYELARQTAKAVENPLAQSYAVGYQGHLYELAKRNDESLALTRRAILLAQQTRSAESLYQWQWQAGRIFRAQGKSDEAIALYTAARETLELQSARSDLALGYGNRGMKSNFRAEVGPLYYELADLLMTRADTATDEAKVQQYLSDARNTVERLRVSELESYLEDPCVNQAQARQINLATQLSKVPRGNPAVVYLIPLSDRVEILLTTRKGMQRVKSTGVGAEKLTQTVREFRRLLERRTTHRYIADAQQLYEWLIKPIEPMLQAEQIDTLVFVPDGALRTIPMAALFDGNEFLIAKYAVAVSPGLSLSLSDSNPQQVSTSARKVLASGLSKSYEGFAPLPNVDAELSTIQNLYGATTLLNDDFKVPAFEQQLRRSGQEEYSIVHIASHGVFAADVKDTFVLASDGRLNLGSLQSLLQPYQLQGKPIDLLTLSACQTSAGDDQSALERASLGLGGLAVKAGARSAMASLWFANDEATGQLITAFYEQLRDHPEAGKANALQRAQLQLIQGEDFSHPVYWAPFLMIGDWL